MAVRLDDPNVFSPASSFSTFGDLVDVIVRNAFVLAGVMCFVLLVIGGFGVIMGAGDTKKTEQSKQAITGAVVGLIIVITSYWIVQIIEKLTGVPLLGTK
ncbi:hypothetical protein KKB64_00175 [Patescibacteria group bacterium]|nr:hypothetical protein [Patescibacteria group bacterium]MBU1472191.1 hypothetical protein [Patescibacteria group bacterium]MBU2459585.1 hypothetical protein [Patescibacteria group bacterium]MBU2544174.1 hypothetical protein [Patescibacteria group bacterium]